MSRKMLFVFNPKAGKGKIKMKLVEILDIFTKGGYEIIVYPTQKPQDAYYKAMEYADRVDTIVCSGGDGTLDEVVNGLMEAKSRIPVGYIPAGSTNDFANSLFFPKTMTEAAEMIVGGNIYHCDIGKFNHQTFAYIAAFGLFTDVAYETDQDLKNILGHVAYLLEGVKRLLDIKSYHMKVETEDKVFEEDFIYGMITNSRSVGGFKHLTGKNVDMDDGLFEVTLIARPKNPIELQEVLSSIVMAEDTTSLIYSFKASHVRITSDEPVSWTLDGEYGGSPTEVEIENRHRALGIYLTSTKQEEGAGLPNVFDLDKRKIKP
ncbi:MAG: diacylglycerol kinase family lipid kinase [Eubacteriales bacterium]|nr:diacylglycerol kinase family lipid kinase [Eubacteriales bacterium]